jgi:hypothetical protein
MMTIKSEEEINHQHLICPEFSSESTELPPRNTIVNAYASTLDFEATEYKRLYEILSYPQQLAYFQLYLQNIHAHENLLFMEAMSELRHEQYSEHLDAIVHRYIAYKQMKLAQY